MTISLRPAIPSDREFLFQLYASTRLAEIATFGWDSAQQDAFLRMQFAAQRRWYETAYPRAQEQIVTQSGKPIGRMIVDWRSEATTLVDISLLAEHQGQGIGGRLLNDLLDQSSKQGVSVRLQVLKTNPAARLYQRLGFQVTGEDQLYYQMECALPRGYP